MITKEIQKLADLLERIPGTGPKTALKTALFLASQRNDYIIELSKTLLSVKESTKQCTSCFNYSESTLCSICSDSSRDVTQICVVTDVRDLIALEKTRNYKGRYHVLHGLICSGMGAPVGIRLKELFLRLQEAECSEVILALGSTEDGSYTTEYLLSLLKPIVKTTVISYGLGYGAEIAHAASDSLVASLRGRVEI